MKTDDIEIYEDLRFKVFSQGCEGQADGMLHAIERYLLSDFEYKHSLVRLFLRPVFYMGYEDPIIASHIVNMRRNEEINSFDNGYELQKYMEDNISVIAKIIEELKLCCEYYDVEYNEKQNAVVYKNYVFNAIKGLWLVFLEDFKRLEISEDEIKRIFEEESHSSYKKEFDKIK